MPKNNRKYDKYEDYVSNVVDKCGHKWLIMDRRDFRDWRISKSGGDNSPIPSGKLIKIIPARCKSYSCPICGRKKVHDLVERIKHVDLKGYRFFTLTLKNKYSVVDQEENIKRVAQCFNKLNNNLRKNTAYKNLQYFRIIEIGKNGMIHIHGIWNIYVQIRVLSKMWLNVTGDSYRCDVRRIKGRNDVVNYIFKYITKNVVQKDKGSRYQTKMFELDVANAAKLFYENGKRRWQASRNFFPKNVKVTGDYVPFYFEPDEPSMVETIVKNLVNEFHLKKEHFDFGLYNESDLFIESLFDTS